MIAGPHGAPGGMPPFTAIALFGACLLRSGALLVALVRRTRSAAVAAALASAMPAAHAAHPLQTEDTSTQGLAVYEVEHGLSVARAAASRIIAYVPHVAVGVTGALDVIVQPSWIVSRTRGERSVRGFGDTSVDAKWRFAAAAPWSFATRIGTGLATSQNGLGIPHGTFSPHALVVASYSVAPMMLLANASLAHVPSADAQRENLVAVASAVLWSPGPHWTLASEATAGRNPDRAGRAVTGTTLAAVIYTVRPQFDIDLGYQRTYGLNPSARTWLLGVTYHIAR